MQLYVVKKSCRLVYRLEIIFRIFFKPIYLLEEILINQGEVYMSRSLNISVAMYIFNFGRIFFSRKKLFFTHDRYVLQQF